MPMNPIRATYAASATGAQVPLSVDWRDSPNGFTFEVQFNAGASGSVTVETTVDNINDPSITPDWMAASVTPITADQRGGISGPIQFIRLNIGSLAGGTLTFKVLEGSPAGASGGSSSGGGSGSSSGGAFNPTGGSGSLSVTSVNSRVQLTGSGDQVYIANIGTKEAFVKFGDNAVVAAVTDMSIPAGLAAVFYLGANGYVAGISSGADTTTLRLTRGVRS